MKFYKLLSLMIALLLAGGCDDDDSGGDVMTDPVAPEISVPAEGTSLVVDETNQTTELTISWSEADFGVDLAVSYEVQLDVHGGAFSNPAVLTSGITGTSTGVTYGTINSSAINDLSQAANMLASLDLRVVASSTGFDDLVSGVVGLSLTTFQGATMTAPAFSGLAVSSATLTNDNLDTDLAIEWSAAEFGTTDEITYVLKMGISGDGIGNAIQVAKTTALTYTLTYEALNFYIDQNLNQDANTAVDVDFFVTASSGNESLDSESITANFTTIDATYTEAAVYMTGSFTDPAWEPWNNPQVLPYGDETFWYFDNAHELKFTDFPGWDGNNYGYESDGVLTTTGTDNIPVEAGHYQVVVNTEELTYAFNSVEWGVIGSATPGGWDESTAMTYNVENHTWEVTLDLVEGALKFRANNAWDINLGPRDSFTHRGELIHTDGSIDFGGNPGNFKVIVSFDTSVTPYKWNFEVIKN